MKSLPIMIATILLTSMIMMSDAGDEKTDISSELKQFQNDVRDLTEENEELNEKLRGWLLFSLDPLQGLIYKGPWKKASSTPVCFSATTQKYGKFHAPKSGSLAAIKLVHVYGYVTCHTPRAGWSYWGCSVANFEKGQINVIITDSSEPENQILLPPSQFMVSSDRKWSEIGGYNEFSKELVLSVFSDPPSVTSGQELRLWYGEAFVGKSTSDNGGEVCCDVYARYV